MILFAYLISRLSLSRGGNQRISLESAIFLSYCLNKTLKLSHILIVLNAFILQIRFALSLFRNFKLSFQ